MPANDPLACPHYPACSGCSAIGMHYWRQLEAKLLGVRSQLTRAHAEEVQSAPIRSITSAPDVAAYRNRAKLVPARSGPGVPARTDDGISLGLYRAGSHDVVDIPGCPVQRDAINRTVEVVRAEIARADIRLYDEATRMGDLRFVCVREGARTGELLVALVTRDPQFPGGENLAESLMACGLPLAGVVQNINPTAGNAIFGETDRVLAGRGWIEEIVCDVRVRLGASSFFQVNTPVAERAYRAMIGGLSIRPGDALADLYCGVGAIGLIAAARGARVLGIESDTGAVELARGAVSANASGQAEFHVGRVEHETARIRTFAKRVDPNRRFHVVVNPPRRGLDPAVIRAIVDARPSRIAYLSCQPRTLVRDLDDFARAGYVPRAIELFDMFPQTEQVETLAILEHNDPG